MKGKVRKKKRKGKVKRRGWEGRKVDVREGKSTWKGRKSYAKGENGW